MDSSSDAEVGQTPEGLWYRSVSLPHLAAFGARFDELIQAYEDAPPANAGIETPRVDPEREASEMARDIEERFSKITKRDPGLLGRAMERLIRHPLAGRLVQPAPGEAAGPARDAADGMEVLKERYPNEYQKYLDLMAMAGEDPSSRPPGASGRSEGPAPDGTVAVHFIGSKSITENHERLCRWLVAEERRIAGEVRACLARTAPGLEEEYASCIGEDAARLLPTAGNGPDHPDMIRIRRIEVDAAEPLAGLYFDCTWNHVLVDNTDAFVVYFFQSKVVAYGDVLALAFEDAFLESAPEDLVNRLGL